MKLCERNRVVWMTATTVEQVAILRGLLQAEDVVKGYPTIERTIAIVVHEALDRRQLAEESP